MCKEAKADVHSACSSLKRGHLATRIGSLRDLIRGFESPFEVLLGEV